MLKAPLLVAPQIRNHKGRYISVPLADVISPRSKILFSFQPNDFRKPLKSGKTVEAVHQYIREIIPHADKDRIYSLDIEKAVEIIESRRLTEIVQQMNPGTFSEFHQLFETF